MLFGVQGASTSYCSSKVNTGVGGHVQGCLSHTACVAEKLEAIASRGWATCVRSCMYSSLLSFIAIEEYMLGPVLDTGNHRRKG